MRIREIKCILAIVSEGSITGASKSLFMAQPSLSQLLKKVEQQLGCKLFNRIGNKLCLTYAGERFVESGSRILKIYRDMENEFSDISQLKGGNIIIGIPYYLGSHMFPIFGPVFNKRYPGISIKLIESKSSELENLIVSGQVDIAVLPNPIEDASIKYETLFTSRMILLVNKDNPINKHSYQKKGFRFPYIDIKLADGKPFIVGLPGQRIHQINEIMFRKADINPKIVFKTRNTETIKRMASAGAGFAIIPDKYLDFIPTSPDLRCYYIEDEYDYPFAVVAAYHKNNYISEATREFLSIVKELF